jgi:hypothetical protein
MGYGAALYRQEQSLSQQIEVLEVLGLLMLRTQLSLLYLCGRHDAEQHIYTSLHVCSSSLWAMAGQRHLRGLTPALA